VSERVALLTGASSGMGYATARRLLTDGYAVIIASRSPREAAEALGERAIPVVCDLSEVSGTRACLAAVERIGRLDALLLNHGGPPVMPIASIGDDLWRRWSETMLIGPLRLFRDCIPHLARQGGRVVAISSFTVKAPYSGAALSNALRAALANALRTAACELGDQGILVNIVGPGFIATPRARAFNDAQAQRRGVALADVDAEVLSQIPLGRYGTPEEVAEVVAFLLSERNGYLTGQHLLVDGALVVAT